MRKLSGLLEFMYTDENRYVDEIDRLQTDAHSVRLLPENACEKGGWIYLPAVTGSGDWNLARLVGSAAEALACEKLLPHEEMTLLVPDEAAGLFAGKFRQQPALHYYLADCADCLSPRADLKLPEGFDIEERPGDGLYMFFDGQMQGYVKIIRNTRNFSEVYIELRPAIRGRNLAPAILARASAMLKKQQKIMTYVVADDNAPSLATAKRAGLHHIFSLHRFLRDIC